MNQWVLTALEPETEGLTTDEVVEVFEKVKEPGVVKTYLQGLVPDILGFAFQLVVAVIVYFIGVRIIKLLRRLVRKALDRRETDEGVKQFLDALIKCVCYVLLVLLILSLFGIATTSAIAVLGSAGLTIGLALQGSLSNFAGGVLILMLKPFRVGDYIVEDTHGNEGTVAEISLFYTKLKSIDNKVIVIPNGTLANSSLTNATHSDKRRVDIEIGVSYQADLKEVKEVISKLLQDEPDRIREEEPQVFVSELGDSSVIIGIRMWTRTERYWECRWHLMEQIKLTLDEHQIEIPYPQIDVHMSAI